MKTLNFEDLIQFRKKAQADLNVRELSYDAVSEKACGLAVGTEHIQLLCCGGTGCKASNSAKIVDNLKAAIEANGIANKVEVIVTGCFGFCEKGPIVKVIPDNTFYTQVKPEDAEEIVKEHVIGGRRVERLLYVDPKTGGFPAAVWTRRTLTRRTATAYPQSWRNMCRMSLFTVQPIRMWTKRNPSLPPAPASMASVR